MIFKLNPVFSEKVWGGTLINKLYNYDCSDSTGEAWGISAHKHGSSTITNTVYKGKTLRELYKEHKELFGNYPKDEFPILIKVIDANDDLSIQVHPNDDYAKKHEDSLGKTECWYVLDAASDANMVVGHKAKNLEEFKKYVEHNDFESIINRFPIKKGDAFNIYSGTIHAICKGTLLLEIQQSSDVTYRLYDYNRLSNGKLRDLHLDKALDCITFPDNTLATEKPKHLFDYHILKNKGITEHKSDRYGDYIFIIEGKGKFNDLDVKKGDFLMISSNEDYLITGDIEYFKSKIA